jgi:hypothetical protein
MFFWDKAPCGLGDGKKRFGEAYCFHLQGSQVEPGVRGGHIGWQEREVWMKVPMGTRKAETKQEQWDYKQASREGRVGEGKTNEVSSFQGPLEGVDCFVSFFYALNFYVS